MIFKAAPVWRKHTPFGSPESFWMRQLKTVAQGLQPIHSANTLGTFPYKRPGTQRNSKGSLHSRSTQSSGGGWQVWTKFCRHPRKRERGPPWVVREGFFVSQQHYSLLPPANDDSWPRTSPFTMPSRSKLPWPWPWRSSWKKEKKNPLDIEQGSANLFCKGPDSTYLGLCRPRGKTEGVVCKENIRENKFPQTSYWWNSEYNSS